MAVILVVAARRRRAATTKTTAMVNPMRRDRVLYCTDEEGSTMARQGGFPVRRGTDKEGARTRRTRPHGDPQEWPCNVVLIARGGTVLVFIFYLVLLFVDCCLSLFC